MAVPRRNPWGPKRQRLLSKKIGARSLRPEKQVEGSEGVASHASKHQGGSDPITPGGIGAAPVSHGHIQNNYTAIAAPSSTEDDADAGYSVGSVWVDVSGNLSYICVDSTVDAAIWTEITAGAAGGEANTASSAGSGTSLFYQKSGVDLQLNAIKSENNRLTIALDGVTHDVELTVVEANIDHDALANFVAAEHVDWAGAGAGTIHTDNYIEGGAGTDTTALHDNEANEITAITPKTTLVGADEFVIEDSAASFVKKAVTITSLVASLRSVHQYIFTPDAAPGADVATGAHQGNIYVSGPSTETVKRITVICETAAGTAFTFTLDYDSGNDDFDTFTVDTEIDEVAVGTAKGVIVSAGFTTATITAQSLISLDITTITGSAPKDVTIILEVWRPLQI